MLRAGVERRLRDEHAEDGYWFPAYDDYCFSNVPETALSVLEGSFDRRLPEDVLGTVTADVDTVVLLLLDGFGYEHWKREHREHAFLSTLTERGRVTPLTSIYPSETAAAITTLSTGLPPVEHGLLGWFQHLESAGRIVETLPFATLEGEPVGAVSPRSDPRELFEGESLHRRAAEAGVETYAIQPSAFVDSGYTRATTDGAERVGYDTTADFALSIRRALESASGPTFVYAYEPTIDAVSHAEGTGGERYRVNLEAICERLERELLERLDPAVAERTLLLVTADHGFVDTDPEANVALRALDDWPSLRETFRRDASGDPRMPTGSPRNLHLHVRPGRLEEARGILESTLDARTFTREEALERGLFGPGTPSRTFDRRCGDLVVVHRSRGVWPSREEVALRGLHGGLTREEMLVPFAAGKLDALR